ncbi:MULTISPECIES: hypothetical protein [Streptomyces]|uniref:hypothetical protein n=1 Tax=Streptomyces TaxID=1883 RepID=UPI001EFE9E58|nr:MULTISPECIES: hypothetical protein [unclassified Streptomyces]
MDLLACWHLGARSGVPSNGFFFAGFFAIAVEESVIGALGPAKFSAQVTQQGLVALHLGLPHGLLQLLHVFLEGVQWLLHAEHPNRFLSFPSFA